MALCFNLGGPVEQYMWAAQGMLMLACHSLTAVEAEYQQGHEEVASHTRNTGCIDKLMKGNCGKIVAPASNYMDTKLNVGTYCSLL